MIANLSKRERHVRAAASAALVVVALLGSYSMAFVWSLYLAALLLAITAATTRCPMYHIGTFLSQRRSRPPHVARDTEHHP